MQLNFYLNGLSLKKTELKTEFYLMSPSCPYDALTVGNANAAVNDFTASDVTPLIVVSMTKCGGLLFRMDAL